MGRKEIHFSAIFHFILSSLTMRIITGILLLTAFTCVYSSSYDDYVPTKPVWPDIFDGPFGLGSLIPYFTNASSHFWYDYTLNNSTRIDYLEKCLPTVTTGADEYPCTLWFNPTGTFVNQKETLGCCLLFEGVGSIPPNFLAEFTYQKVEDAPDMYGNETSCFYWESSLLTGLFGYWTSAEDYNKGADIKFRDGPTGVTCNWGALSTQSQNTSIYDLPSSECQNPCSSLVKRNVMKGMDPYTRLALEYHKLSQRLAEEDAVDKVRIN